MNGATRFRAVSTLFLFLVWPQILIAQDAAKSPIKDSVKALLDRVKDVAQFEKELDATHVVFALASRVGGIINAVKPVVEAHQEKRAVVELISLIKTRRLSTKRTDELICAGAAYALGEFGPAAADALPTLTLLKEHPNQMTKGDAERALERIKKRDSKE